MEENTEKAMEPTKKKSKVEEILEADRKNPPKRVNKTWEAAMRLKGSLIVNDPTFLLYGAQNETYIEGWEKKTSNLLIYKRLCKV